MPEVAVRHVERGPRGVPDLLGGEADGRRLDLLDEVETQIAAIGVREGLQPAGRERVRRGRLAGGVAAGRELVDRAGEDLVPRVRLDEPRERRLVALGLLLAHGDVETVVEPREVGVEEGGAVGILVVETQQRLVQRERLQFRRSGVGGFRSPREERLGVAEDRTRAVDLEGVLGRHAAELAGLVERQRLAREEVEERGPVGVGHVALFDQEVPRRDRRLLEHGRRGERGVEVLADLGEDAREIPGLDIGARRGGGLRALVEAPAVVLEVLPVPVAQQRLHHRLHRGRRFGELDLEAGDLLLGLVALDRALEGDLAADRAHGLGIGLVGERALDDRLEPLDGGLRQAFVGGFVDRFPLIVAWTGEEVRHGGE